MKTPYRKSFFFAISVLLMTWTAASHAGQMEAGSSVEERSGVGEGSSAAPRSWITLEPSVVDDIERNTAFLKRMAPRIRTDLRDLKRSGILDHDSVVTIESTLNQAQTSMARLVFAKRSRKLTKTRATALADDLVSLAEDLESYIGDIDGGSTMGPQRAFEKQERVIEALSDVSRMLHNTGRVVHRCIDR
jgi:hypothetical protein